MSSYVLYMAAFSMRHGKSFQRGIRPDPLATDGNLNLSRESPNLSSGRHTWKIKSIVPAEDWDWKLRGTRCETRAHCGVIPQAARNRLGPLPHRGDFLLFEVFEGAVVGAGQFHDVPIGLQLIIRTASLSQGLGIKIGCHSATSAAAATQRGRPGYIRTAPLFFSD